MAKSRNGGRQARKRPEEASCWEIPIFRRGHCSSECSRRTVAVTHVLDVVSCHLFQGPDFRRGGQENSSRRSYEIPVRPHRNFVFFHNHRRCKTILEMRVSTKENRKIRNCSKSPAWDRASKSLRHKCSSEGRLRLR